ncbi:MFS transporter [Phenylobacterium sp.]|jgi:PPP family 3-phenylpropionic acid transporter|uniref:MFS transporter n=1 Tax=Phenylobacterium sp. TaxID=1871053 RepID=UPI002E37B2D3|nr:MFS transporter [Phenylobacterium sp.]HEX2558509.1 MFS transporter [Phenylobacterium sp.]
MSSAVRIGLCYSAIFVGTGAMAPYMPVWFAERGLSGAQIGLILSLPMLARVVTAPALAVWADSFALRRTPLILLSLATALGYLLMAAPFGFPWWMAVWFVAASAFATLPPLTDVVALARARTEGFNYGWPRGIGSAAFIVANIVAGALLVATSADAVLVWIVAAALLAALASRFLLPPDPVLEHGGVAELRERLAGLGLLLKDRLFLLAVLSVGLIQSAHAFYYSFSALAWKAQGIPENLTGVLWGVRVAVEIVFMWFLEPWRRKIGPRRLLVIGGLAALVRWTAYAFAPPLWLLFPLQALHALSYAATFLASLQLVERLSSPVNMTAAQTINSAFSSGLLAGLATLASGPLFDRYGAGGYLLMTAMSLIGVLGALRLYAARRLED